MDEIEILQKLSFERDTLAETFGRMQLNEVVSEYFLRLYEEYSLPSCLAESQRILECSNVWICDNYEKSNVSDVTYVSHCRSRFCLVCQKLLQASRLNRFSPFLIETAKDYDLYHITFTIPNVPAAKLKAAIKLMAYAFRRLIKFLSGKKKIKGLDFSEYGFHACLRSLEVTFSEIRQDFHPHYHCIFALKKGLCFDKHIINDFSYDNGILVDLFSDFEILLQKLWRLLIDGEREKIYRYVEITERLGKPLSPSDPMYGHWEAKPTKKNRREGAITLSAINALKQGYSCKMEFIEDDDVLNYYEVFKYAFKVTSDERTLFTYEQFKALYFGLKGARAIQGYGAWYNLKCDDFDDSVDEFYAVLIGYLRQRETPYSQRLTLPDILNKIDNNNTIFITKRSIRKWLRYTDTPPLSDFAATLGNPHPYTSVESKRFHITDVTTAYYRYLNCKRTSDLFADVRAVTAAESKSTSEILTLTPEQLSFLDSIF